MIMMAGFQKPLAFWQGIAEHCLPTDRRKAHRNDSWRNVSQVQLEAFDVEPLLFLAHQLTQKIWHIAIRGNCNKVNQTPDARACTTENI
jgi:hypothetical protein